MHTSTTEHTFVPGHLYRLSLDPGQKQPIVPGPTTSRASGETEVFYHGCRHQPGQKRSFLSRVVAPTETKDPVAFLSRVESPPGTKGSLLSRVEPAPGTKSDRRLPPCRYFLSRWLLSPLISLPLLSLCLIFFLPPPSSAVSRPATASCARWLVASSARPRRREAVAARGRGGAAPAGLIDNAVCPTATLVQVS